ncbi:TPA: LOW QUALITY PROTEIN: hypothetical protein N0F65_009906 [Lagenidium giganteum]|uniref:Uncharacterized protein n=1 Tax=Lagenidium giganteum TaxID=4803 RepID=A0AAV2YTP5_9STRA|nr:TPA: LOW QUALITY PROTEIN: hypothetical protein N0F65_009906 [Lagenidium giganteum]
MMPASLSIDIDIIYFTANNNLHAVHRLRLRLYALFSHGLQTPCHRSGTSDPWCLPPGDSSVLGLAVAMKEDSKSSARSGRNDRENMDEAAPSGTVGSVVGLLNTVQYSLGSAARSSVATCTTTTALSRCGGWLMWALPVTMVALAVFAYFKRKCNPNAPQVSPAQSRVMSNACVEMTASAN